MATLRTALCDLLQITVPIIQAPMAVATPALVAAVSNAGGLGMLGLANRDPEGVRRVIGETQRLTARPFGGNFHVRPNVEINAPLDACLDLGVPVVSFHWDDPSAYVARVHAAGALVTYAVSSAAEARRAVDAGVDVVVAQGWEAGGHVRGEVATLPLVPRVVDAVTPTLVVAAGGIADGRGMAAALTLGAVGVWMGTRFMMSTEAATHPLNRERLAQAQETDTVYTTVFDIGWPDAPHRALRNTTIDRWEAAGRPPSGRRPGEGELLGHAADGRPIVRYRSLNPAAGATGDIEAMSLYAGQSVGLVTQNQPAADIVRVINEEATRVLRRCGVLVRAEENVSHG